jgi:hypothetical protein
MEDELEKEIEKVIEISSVDIPEYGNEEELEDGIDE